VDLGTLDTLMQAGSLATLLAIFYRLGHLGERVRAIEARVSNLERNTA
jgi:hypothetical protein